MSHGRRAVIGLLALGAAGTWPLPAPAQAQREVHGALDAWAEPGLALAWGVLRGRDEATTRVVVRIEVQAQRQGRIEVLGRDPFGGGTVDVAVVREPDGAWRIELPLGHFAEHPRTELRFFTVGQAQPRLLVYSLGVPDTTPEFASPLQLEADLRARLGRARTAPERPQSPASP